MEKKKTPKDLRRLRGKTQLVTYLDVASTWERPGSMQQKDLVVGRIVFTRQQVCWQNAGRLPSNAYKILSTDTNWYKRRDRVRPVQKEGENGILIVELNNCEGTWVAGFCKPFVEPLENLVTKTDFKTQCQEKARIYAT